MKGQRHADISRIDTARQVGGETMTIRTRRDDTNYRNLNNKDWQGDTRKRTTPQAMPELAEPFEQVGDCHWLLWHDPVSATLWYDRQYGMWSVRFDWPDIQDMQFERDAPAMQMREKIIDAIDKGTQ